MTKLKNHEAQMHRQEDKEKRKARKEKFREDHPVLADLWLKTKVAAGVFVMFAVPFALGYSCRRRDETRWEEIYNDTNEDVMEALKSWSEGPKDYIDDEKKYHQDIGLGCFAVWPDAETYLAAETQRLKALSENK